MTTLTPGHTCPDGGTCHHECDGDPDSLCWRTSYAAPLSGIYPDDYWPTSPMAYVPVVPVPALFVPHRRDLQHHGAVTSRPVLPDVAVRKLATIQVIQPERWAAAFPPDAWEYR